MHISFAFHDVFLEILVYKEKPRKVTVMEVASGMSGEEPVTTESGL